MHASEVGRASVFMETKIWISDNGYDETLHAFDKSAGKLGVDQIGPLMLHQALWPDSRGFMTVEDAKDVAEAGSSPRGGVVLAVPINMRLPHIGSSGRP